MEPERQPLEISTAADIPLDVACPECGARVRIRAKYDQKMSNFMRLMGTQPEMSSLAGNYTFKNSQACSCGKTVIASLHVIARNMKKPNA